MDERDILKDVNQIKILSLFYIHGQPQVMEALRVYLQAISTPGLIRTLVIYASDRFS
jgi:hypothetical protein